LDAGGVLPRMAVLGSVLLLVESHSREETMEATMLEHLSRNWGWVVLRGVAAVLFGVLAFVLPGITLAVLVIVWGAYALADGILALIAAYRVRDQGKPFWSLVIVGLLGIAAGIVTFIWPGMTALLLLLFIAAWAIVMGIFQMIAAIRLRKEIQNEWLLGLSGVLSVLFGIIMFVQPGAGALALIWVIAAYAIVFGVLLIWLGLRLKKRSESRAVPA
jgi:uncharacterized membrane protein HdeD (DUF308 family)